MPVDRVLEATWRIEAPRLVAGLARLLHDVGLAEDVAQDAFVLALESWAGDGVPDNPGAWLTTVARRRAVDLIRRERGRDAKYRQIARTGAGDAAPAPDAVVDDPIGDDLLSLVFVTCHPVLPADSRVALTLRLVAGLSTEEIAHAFLVPTATMGQRISRAKRTVREARIPIAVPQADEWPDRVATVLEVVYLVFSEGYAATTGDRWVRRDLASEAMRLGRVLVGLLPGEPEAHGLVALMELQASRFAAREAPDGTPVLLRDQDRSRWDRTLVRHGLRALDLARARAVTHRRAIGPYTLQAAIASEHARSPSWADTDWEAIVTLYDALLALTGSPVVALNRAVAVLHADGPDAALRALDGLRDDPHLRDHHLYSAVRAEVLLHLGDLTGARAALDRAAAQAPTTRERDLLSARAAAVGR